MKIYSRLVIDIHTFEILEEESFEYEGSLALCGGGDGGAGGAGAGSGSDSDSSHTGGSWGDSPHGNPEGTEGPSPDAHGGMGSGLSGGSDTGGGSDMSRDQAFAHHYGYHPSIGSPSYDPAAKAEAAEVLGFGPDYGDQVGVGMGGPSDPLSVAPGMNLMDPNVRGYGQAKGIQSSISNFGLDAVASGLSSGLSMSAISDANDISTRESLGLLGSIATIGLSIATGFVGMATAVAAFSAMSRGLSMVGTLSGKLGMAAAMDSANDMSAKGAKLGSSLGAMVGMAPLGMFGSLAGMAYGGAQVGSIGIGINGGTIGSSTGGISGHGGDGGAGFFGAGGGLSGMGSVSGDAGYFGGGLPGVQTVDIGLSDSDKINMSLLGMLNGFSMFNSNENMFMKNFVSDMLYGSFYLSKIEGENKSQIGTLAGINTVFLFQEVLYNEGNKIFQDL